MPKYEIFFCFNILATYDLISWRSWLALGGLPGLLSVLTSLGNPPQGNQEPSVVNARMEDPRWAWGSKSVEYNTFPFTALTLSVGRQEGHPICKTLHVDLLVMTIRLELCTFDSSSCRHHLHKNPEWWYSGTGLLLLSWKMAVRRVLWLLFCCTDLTLQLRK